MSTIQENIAKLESSLTGDMFSDMEAKEQIHKLKMKLEGVESINESCSMDEGCDSCGA
jgi:hypothetical protein